MSLIHTVNHFKVWVITELYCYTIARVISNFTVVITVNSVNDI